MALKSEHTIICTEHHKNSLGVNKVYPVSIKCVQTNQLPQ